MAVAMSMLVTVASRPKILQNNSKPAEKKGKSGGKKIFV
jgi:hypothetical protein